MSGPILSTFIMCARVLLVSRHVDQHLFHPPILALLLSSSSEVFGGGGREMGIWDLISSTTETMKRKTPDLTSVKQVGQSCYNLGGDAVTAVDNVVRVNVLPKLGEYMPDQNGRAKICQAAVNMAQAAAPVALYEVAKTVPVGVPLYNMGLRYLSRQESENHQADIKALQAKIDVLEKEVSAQKLRLHEQEEKFKHTETFNPPNVAIFEANRNLKPEDVIRVFMMKGFYGQYFLDDMIVPRKNPK
ncbi:hypothetical protein RJ641_023097 [Dillenia turbinata]|uniref:Uncharacterized protein n=1 Tax=Dillenia turbinata TaxID=194707 RepID=A0AAN8ULQ3_9MAGN